VVYSIAFFSYFLSCAALPFFTEKSSETPYFTGFLF
jgi:hypothetical protein